MGPYEARNRFYRMIILYPFVLCGIMLCPLIAHGEDAITYTGDGTDLQQLIDRAADHAIIECDASATLTLSQPLTIRRPLTLQGLHAQLPEKLGRTSLIEVYAEGVVLRDLELHGNYDSVSQDERSPLIWIARGDFLVERCRLFDGSKDGVMITPEPEQGDLIGGVVRDIEAFRMGRDAVSISGGNQGAKVRNVTVENVRLEKGYHRGAVEVSDGTEDIVVREVHAEQCVYAVDVQDHKKNSAANVDILLDSITAVDCTHIVRTANSPRDHTGLVLRNLVATRCTQPLKISHTRNVVIDGVRIEEHAIDASPPVQLHNCNDVSIAGVEIVESDYAGESHRCNECTDVNITANEPKSNQPLDGFERSPESAAQRHFRTEDDSQ